MWKRKRKKKHRKNVNIKHAKFLHLTVWEIKQNKFTYLPNRESLEKIFGYFSAGWIKKFLEHQMNTLKWTEKHISKSGETQVI